MSVELPLQSALLVAGGLIALYLGASALVKGAGSLALRLGMSDTALRSELQRLRECFRNAVRQEVAATVETPSEVDAELHHLLAVLRERPVP